MPFKAHLRECLKRLKLFAHFACIFRSFCYLLPLYGLFLYDLQCFTSSLIPFTYLYVEGEGKYKITSDGWWKEKWEETDSDEKEGEDDYLQDPRIILFHDYEFETLLFGTLLMYFVFVYKLDFYVVVYLGIFKDGLWFIITILHIFLLF